MVRIVFALLSRVLANSVRRIGSECYPFVKTGGLGDVMYALPKALVKQNCDVKVILPRSDIPGLGRPASRGSG